MLCARDCEIDQNKVFAETDDGDCELDEKSYH